MVTYEAMSNASAQRAACREHKGRSVHVMAGVKPNVATCDEPQRTGHLAEAAGACRGLELVLVQVATGSVCGHWCLAVSLA